LTSFNGVFIEHVNSEIVNIVIMLEVMTPKKLYTSQNNSNRFPVTIWMKIWRKKIKCRALQCCNIELCVDNWTQLNLLYSVSHRILMLMPSMWLSFVYMVIMATKNTHVCTDSVYMECWKRHEINPLFLVLQCKIYIVWVIFFLFLIIAAGYCY
jgi:hypothetical protein